RGDLGPAQGALRRNHRSIVGLLGRHRRLRPTIARPDRDRVELRPRDRRGGGVARIAAQGTVLDPDPDGDRRRRPDLGPGPLARWVALSAVAGEPVEPPALLGPGDER